MKKSSYMEICLHFDGRESLYLRIPTLWDETKKQWIGFVKTPVKQKLIHGKGKTSFDLQNDFIVNINKIFEAGGEIKNDLISMFKPKQYWESDER